MPPQRKTIGEVLAGYRRSYDMSTRSAVGGPPGATPLGDRPGTTTATKVAGGWSGTPAGRARVIAAGAFVVFVFVHMAAENRYAA